jgi:hypothetical protein
MINSQHPNPYHVNPRYCKGDASVPGTPAVNGEELRWCQERVPNLYAFVQREYWGVGLFRYYQLKQVRSTTHSAVLEHTLCCI